jgi:hypothetical protein
MSSLLDYIFGSEDRFEKLNNYSPEQMQVLNQTTNMAGKAGGGANDVLEYLMQFMNPESDVYKNFEAPYLREYEHGVGQLAERFAAGANGGALSSSGFAQALGGAQGDLQAKLAGLKSGLQRQAGQDILGQYNTSSQNSLSARPYDYKQVAGNEGLLPGALKAYLGGAAGGGGMGGMLTSLLQNILFNGPQGKQGANRVGGNVAAGASAGRF